MNGGALCAQRWVGVSAVLRPCVGAWTALHGVIASRGGPPIKVRS